MFRNNFHCFIARELSSIPLRLQLNQYFDYDWFTHWRDWERSMIINFKLNETIFRSPLLSRVSSRSHVANAIIIIVVGCEANREIEHRNIFIALNQSLHISFFIFSFISCSLWMLSVKVSFNIKTRKKEKSNSAFFLYLNNHHWGEFYSSSFQLFNTRFVNYSELWNN